MVLAQVGPHYLNFLYLTTTEHRQAAGAEPRASSDGSQEKYAPETRPSPAPSVPLT